MTGSATLLNTLAARRDSRAAGWMIRIASVAFITALTAASAQFSVPLPFTSVPFTLQPMVVLLGGLALGARLGCASQILYLAAGAAGLPVFAASATLPPGILRLIGPTAGYLLSYPLAAFITGYFSERGADRTYGRSVIAMLAGLSIVYCGGVLWLGLFARTTSAPIGLQAALYAGVVPFLAADVLKVIAGAGIMPGIWRLLGANGPHDRRQ